MSANAPAAIVPLLSVAAPLAPVSELTWELPFSPLRSPMMAESESVTAS